MQESNVLSPTLLAIGNKNIAVGRVLILRTGEIQVQNLHVLNVQGIQDCYPKENYVVFVKREDGKLKSNFEIKLEISLENNVSSGV